VRSGEISEERINESVSRILETKARFGVLDWQPLDVNSASQRVNAAQHEQVVENLFRAGVTVAYDRNNAIPLTARRIAIIFLATRYQIQNECSAYNPAIRWVGVGDSPSDEEIGWAVEAAQWSDTAVVFTQNAITNPNQQALVNALPPEKTVAVALFSPYDWTTFPGVSAYVATYSPMRPAVPAACAILFGAAPALGQLPVTLSPELPAGSHAASP
jgi:beta-N-acetylhexosaminidase